MRSPHRNRLRAAMGGRERRCRRGFSLIEAAVSVVIVGGVLVVALNTVAASKRTQYLTGTRGRGQLLAQALMAEILSQPFEEADAPDSFGLEAGENSEKRDRYDDVDDYYKWSGSPPEDKDGQVIPGFEGWTRTATVVWVNPWNLTTVAWAPTGIKRITVTVKRGELVVASMVAVRTEAWPVDKDDTVKVLFVVTSSGSPAAEELARKAVMEEWGFVVTLINASAPQSAFDVAAGKANVAYVSDRIHGNDLNTKLRGASIGVVDEDQDVYDDFGFSSSSWWYTNITVIDIVDNAHYITSPFSIGELTIFVSGQYLASVWSETPDLHVLAEKTKSSSKVLTILETGGAAIRWRDGSRPPGPTALGNWQL